MSIRHRGATADIAGLTASASAAQSAATAAGNAATAAGNRVTAIENAPYLRGTRGRKMLTANIAVGTTTNVIVSLDATLPTSDYTALVSLEGSAGILGQLSAVIVAGSKTTSQVTVAVQNSSLIAVGLNVTVGVAAFYT